ncbi:MAG: Crp/Fnr family transcriptional regulator [Uliginosibacterium sp.]|jgi:CRP-like cAMP-binding protein|nr:Crp/Fnr family transcriptional regulator [Uliginosibacterium sp.]
MDRNMLINFCGAERNPNRIEALASVALMQGVKQESLQMLAAASHQQRIAANVNVFECGESPAGSYLVLDGMVALLAPDLSGRMHIVELFGPGRLFGDSGLIWGDAYGVSAKTIKPCRLMRIPPVTLREVMQIDTTFRDRVLQENALRIRSLLQRVGYFATDSSLARVAAYLSNLQPSFFCGKEYVEIPAPKRMIASLLNMSSESFSRALKSLKEDRLIIVSNAKVFILCRAGLCSKFQSTKKTDHSCAPNPLPIA